MNATAKTCGPCTLCCKLLDVEEIAKPPERWCIHADKGKGCRIYDTRPNSCRMFDCLWLTQESLGPAFRPDRIRTVMLGFERADGRKAVVAVCDRATPLAWRAEPMLSKLRAGAANGYETYAMAGSRFWQVLADHEVEIADLPLPIGNRARAA